MNKQGFSSPDIIFVQKYHKYYSKDFRESKLYAQSENKWETWVTRSEFYRCTNKNSFNSATNYLTRSSACDKTNLEYEEQYERLKEKGLSDEDIVSYMGERPGSTGLFSNKKELTQEDIRKIRKELAETKGTIYEAVLSFTPEFSDKYVSKKMDAYNLLNDVMPKYLESKGLNPESYNWFSAYHTNTDNRHCHIVFYEKPGHIRNNQDILFVQKDFNKFKELVAFNHPLEHEYENAREPIMAQLKDAMHLPNFYNQLEPIREIVRTKNQYARCTNEQKEAIRAYVDFLYHNCQPFKTAYDDCRNKIKSFQTKLEKLYDDNHIPKTDKITKFALDRIKEYDLRIFNTIMKNAKYDQLLNDQLTRKASGKKKSMFFDQDLIHHTKQVEKHLKKFQKKNPEAYADFDGLSLWSKQTIFAVTTSYNATMNTKAIWNDIINDRRKAIADKLSEARENNELLDDELLEERAELEKEIDRY